MVLGSCEGLANKSVTSSSLAITFTSKKFNFCLKYSAGDFNGVWKVFNLLILFSRDSYPCSKIKTTLSMYAHCAIGNSSRGFKIFFSKSVKWNSIWRCKHYSNLCSPYQFKTFFVKFKNVSVLLQQVLILCHLSLVCYPFIMVLTKKSLSFFRLPHTLSYPKDDYMVSSNNPLCPRQ